MAFLRKHRERYWLVHNFRLASTVRQVRVYAFDLTADVHDEITRAQHAAEALYPGQIALTWIDTVRQQLQELHESAQAVRWEYQTAQITQQIQHLFAMLDAFDGSAATKNSLLQACLTQVQRRLTPPLAAPAVLPLPRAPRVAPVSIFPHAASDSATPPYALGQGFYLADQVVSHACAAAAASMEHSTGSPHETLAPVILITLMSGRDLWLECQSCHVRWADFPCLEPCDPLKNHRQKITKFDRFCREHQRGDACAILIQYRSGRVERLHGTIAAIDYPSKKIQVSVTHGDTEQAYWRLCDHVYFGELEVQLTEAQRLQLITAGCQTLRPLGRTWYALSDTPEARLLLQQHGIRY